MKKISLISLVIPSVIFATNVNAAEKSKIEKLELMQKIGSIVSLTGNATSTVTSTVSSVSIGNLEKKLNTCLGSFQPVPSTGDDAADLNAATVILGSVSSSCNSITDKNLNGLSTLTIVSTATAGVGTVGGAVALTGQLMENAERKKIGDSAASSEEFGDKIKKANTLQTVGNIASVGGGAGATVASAVSIAKVNEVKKIVKSCQNAIAPVPSTGSDAEKLISIKATLTSAAESCSKIASELKGVKGLTIASAALSGIGALGAGASLIGQKMEKDVRASWWDSLTEAEQEAYSTPLIREGED